MLVLVEAQVACAWPPRLEEAQGRLGQVGIQVARQEHLQIAEGSEARGFLRFGPQEGLPRGDSLGRRYGPILSPNPACGSSTCHRMVQRRRLALMAVVEGQALIAFMLQSTGCSASHALPCRSGLAFACMDEATPFRHIPVKQIVHGGLAA